MSYTHHRRLASITTAATFEQNADFLASDFAVGREESRVRISVAVTGGSRVRLLPNTGAGFNLNGGNSITGSLHTEEVSLDPERTWNVQTDNASGTTVNFLLVDELRPLRP